MPKWGIHNIVLDEAVGKLLASSNSEDQAAGAEMSAHRGLSMLGAIGPDLFFFAPDYEVIDKIYRLYKNIEDIVDLYNKFVQPIRDIRDAVVEPVEDVVETLAPSTVTLIRSLIEEMQETASLFKSTVSTGLFAGVIEGFNFITDLADLPSLSAKLFQQFVPHLQNNEPISKWYWFDMLHYRKTGDFARKLVENAVTPQERAYAYGYSSHIATDLVGHAFVNQIVGGPYRLHPQRHVTVENFMDCRAFDDLDGTSVNETLLDRLGIPEVLPVEIGDLIDTSFRQTYTDPTQRPTTLPGDFLSREQIDQTHEIVFDYLRIMKKMVVKRPEEPFSGVADILADALKDVLEPPPAPPSPPSGTCSLGDTLSFGLTADSRECYDEFFEQLSDWFEYFAELLTWTLETLLDVIDLLLATLLSLPITVLLAILYGLQLLLYEIYQTMHFVLALEGFVYPEPHDLETSHGRNLTTTFQCVYVTRSSDDVTPLPVCEYPRLPNLSVSHLVCPRPSLEKEVTVPDFYPYSKDVKADEFIRNRPLDLSALSQYANAKDPAETIELEKNFVKIGNAVDLTKWMISTATSTSDKDLAFKNWNLDGDRGYGFKTWSGNVTKNSVESVDYIDD